MKKTIIVTAIVVILTSAALAVFVSLTTENTSLTNFAEVKRGNFEIVVSTSGELVAENSIDIKGPNIVRNRNFRSSAIKITDLVSEGTEVKEGDYIATLDKTSYDNRLKDELERLDTYQSNLEMAILDSAVTLADLRNEISNQKYNVEEADIYLQQSIYEPPSVQRKAGMELDRSKRLLEQTKNNYSLKLAQIRNNIKNLKATNNKQLAVVNDLRDVLATFNVTAPSSGMVIYKKNRLGNKIKAGSMLDPFNPVVATIPDLSVLDSKIYVSEIDISKLSPGQQVQITVDAFPGKEFTGYVANIANMGEQLPNSDSKVFEVLVKLNGTDPMLRPSMTTGNRVIIEKYDDVLYIPIESLHAGQDNMTFVYTKDGIRQVVVPGESNDKYIIIEQGLVAGTNVWTTTPDNTAKFRLEGEELTFNSGQGASAGAAGVY